MNWKRCGGKQSWPNLSYYPGIYLEGLRRGMENLSQVIRSLGQDLKPGPLEYKAGVLTTRSLCKNRSFIRMDQQMLAQVTNQTKALLARHKRNCCRNQTKRKTIHTAIDKNKWRIVFRPNFVSWIPTFRYVSVE
jgi:hypothetical protein